MNLGKGYMQLQCSSEDEVEEDLIISQSHLSNLILEINQLLKKPTIDEELGNILLKFIQKLKESESYLKNGIFNISFTEASLLLQSSCVLYGKRVELLWNDVTESLRRFCSYHRKRNNDQTESPEKEEELLLEKMNRFKRCKVVHDQKTNSKESAASSIGNLYQLTSTVPSLSQIVGSSCKNLDYMWSEAAQSSSKLTRLRARVTSLTDNYIRKAIINSKNKGDKICHYHELYLNLHQSGFMLYDDKTTQMYNLRHLVDNVLQSYLSQREITFLKFAECDMWDDFKKYLEQTIVKRLNALVKVQKELMNGGWDRRRPLIAQKPPVDLSMLRFFGKYNVNLNVVDEESVDQEEDDDIEEETALVANSDRDSGVTSAPSSPAKSFMSRRTSEMHSEADSAFQDGCSFSGDDVVVEEEMERNSDKEKHTTSDANLNADDSGYFDDSSSPGKTLNDPGESAISDGDFLNLESNDNSEKNNDSSDQRLEVIQGFGLYNEEDGDEKEENVVEETIVDQKEEKPLVEMVKKKEKKEKKEEKLKDPNSTKQCRKKRKYEETGSNEDEIKKTKLFKQITTSLKKQEKFFLRFYRPEANEGGIYSTEYSDEESDSEDEKLKDHSKIVYLILSEHSYHKLSPSSSLTSSESPTFSAKEVHDDENEDREVHLAVPSEPSHLLLSSVEAAPTGKESRPASARSNNDNNEDSSTSAYANNDEEDGDDEDSDDVNIETEHSRPIIVDDKRMFSERRVALLEWKSFIEPKLEEATRKPDFDIYEYGSRVMDAIPIGDCRSFEQVVKDESPSEVSRFFMATLQLANTYNVELQNIPEGRLANDKMQVKLVSKKRYHEQLKGYVAPSKDSLKRRLHQANSEGLARCKRQKMEK